MNSDILDTILGVSLLVFVITSMLAMGFSLTKKTETAGRSFRLGRAPRNTRI